MAGAGDVETARAAYGKQELARSPLGSNVGAYPPAISKDGKLLFVCTGNDVRVVSVHTGQTVRVLSAHTQPVTSVASNPSNPLQVYTAGLDGFVRLWDYDDAVVLKAWDLQMPIHQLAVSSDGESVVYMSIKAVKASATSKPRPIARVYRRVLNARQAARQVTKLDYGHAMAVSPKLDTVALIDNSCVRLMRVTANGGYQETKLTLQAKPTTVAISVEQGAVAVGDLRGAITLIFCLGDSADPVAASKAVRTVAHWHAHAVRTVTFSPDGAYMLSGGDEAVLVVWQMGTMAKTFLPRLGASLSSLTVSADGTLYALSHDDSSVRVLQASNLRLRQLVQGLKSGRDQSQQTHALLSGLVIEPRFGALVVNGLPGTLQLYQFDQDRHIAEIEVVTRNQTGRTDHGWTAQPRVDFVAFSAQGTWMATVDRTDDHDITATSECALRFWRFSEDSQTYVLNTQMDHPHSTHKVVALCFHPHLPLAITVGQDQRFKVWQLGEPERRKGITDAVVAWYCRGIGYYRDYQCHDAALSADGSLLAVAYGHVITLWDPLTLRLHGTLAHPPPESPVLRLKLVRHGAYLLACTAARLYVWDLLTLSVWWSLELTVTALAVDATTARFAVAVTVKGASTPSATADPAHPSAQGAQAATTHLLVFHPSSPVPLLRHIDVGADGYSALAFVPHATPSAAALASAPLDLLVRTSGAHGRLHRLRTLGAEMRPVADAPAPASLEDARATGLLSALYGASIVSDAGAAAAAPASAEADSGVVVNPTTLPAVLDAPAHTIPRISKVYAAFMQQLLVPASSTTTTTTTTVVAVAATTVAPVQAAAGEAEASVGASMGWLEAEANPFSFLSDVFAALPSLAIVDVPAPAPAPTPTAARTPAAKASAAKPATATATPSGKPRTKTHA